jgi:hypothetical protein
MENTRGRFNWFYTLFPTMLDQVELLGHYGSPSYSLLCKDKNTCIIYGYLLPLAKVNFSTALSITSISFVANFGDTYLLLVCSNLF